jgi:hypothetical protein
VLAHYSVPQLQMFYGTPGTGQVVCEGGYQQWWWLNRAGHTLWVTL